MSRQSAAMSRHFYGGQRKQRAQLQSTPTSSRQSKVYRPGMGLLDNLFDSDEEENPLDDSLDHGDNTLPSYEAPPASQRISRTHVTSPPSYAIPPSGSYASPTSYVTPTAPYSTPERMPGIGQPTRFGGSEVSVMLQQQQGLLTQILKKQEAIEERQEMMEKKQCEMEARILKLIDTQQSGSSSPADTTKRKRIVNKDLSVSML